ncbi:MAG TPA: metalloregulator ArsR/SmtB family transcription factor [Microlunatus sp.]
MEVFAAIDDPVRREILIGLARRDLSAGEIAGCFAISRPAVSRHLRVLRESGLVRDDVSGRRRIYRLSREGLEPLHDWLSRLTAPEPTEVWSTRFDALDTEVRRARRDRSRSTSQPSTPETETPPTETTTREIA